MKRDDAFLKLQSEWYQKLRESGFQDIEKSDGYLKSYDRRTIAFENRDRIMKFHTDLEHILYWRAPDVGPLTLAHTILLLYCQGVKLIQIEKICHCHIKKVSEVIRGWKDYYEKYNQFFHLESESIYGLEY